MPRTGTTRRCNNRIGEQYWQRSATNPARTDRTTYTWDAANRLLKIQQSAAGAVDLTNSYRPDGLRHRRTDASGTTQVIWDGEEPLAQVDTAGNLIQYWSRAGTGGAAGDGFELQERGWARLVKARVPGSANPDQYLHADWQGTVLASSSASGVGLVQNYPPRAWGQDSTTLAPFSWLGNHGYWYEGQLARTLRYVRARWYAEADPHEF